MAVELIAAVEAGAASVGGVGDIDVGPDGPLRAVREQLATELVAPLRDRLARAVADGDGVNEAITKRVRGVYREWKTQRIDEQLDDMFRLAYCQGAARRARSRHGPCCGRSTPTDRRRRTARTTPSPAPCAPATPSRPATSRRRCTPGAAACSCPPTADLTAGRGHAGRGRQ